MIDISRRDRILAAIAAACAAVLFGASVAATRIAVARIDPLTLAFLRYLIGTGCLLLPLLVWSPPRIARKDWLPIGCLGVIFFGLFPWTFSASLHYLPASRGAVILGLMPLLTLVLAVAMRQEVLSAAKSAGVVLAGLGVILAFSGRADGGDTWIGAAFMLLTALFGAIYNVLARPYLKSYSPLHVTAAAMASGTLFLLPPTLVQVLRTGLPVLDQTSVAALVFLGTFGGAIGFFLWAWALQHAAATRVAVFVTLNPIAAAVLGAGLLGEPLGPAFLVGLAAVLAGIGLVTLAPRPGLPNTQAAVSPRSPP